MNRFGITEEERVVFVITHEGRFMDQVSALDMGVHPFWTPHILHAKTYSNLEVAERTALTLTTRLRLVGVEVVKATVHVEYEVKTCL